MKSDSITEIGIDSKERLYIIPENEQFTMIWRSASEVHWDENRLRLYSPKPREWSYYQLNDLYIFTYELGYCAI
ncbi:hypothetical protein [Pedobacter frigoris]|uniref:hypothetical protein n=1 Tax=Pedobacter frigoris TaxID=2571272 RepID=UPI00292E84A2|nr:hypothetical protein [Pedobacter frigoris]